MKVFKVRVRVAESGSPSSLNYSFIKLQQDDCRPHKINFKIGAKLERTGGYCDWRSKAVLHPEI